MDQFDPRAIDRNEDSYFKGYPTPIELAQVAAILSLRAGAENDLNQLFDEALRLLKGARQKLVDDETARKKKRAADKAERQPNLLFDPSQRLDQIRGYSPPIKEKQRPKPRKDKKAPPTRVSKEPAQLPNIKKSSTLERKIRVYCADTNIIFRGSEETLEAHLKELLKTDVVRDTSRKGYRTVYRISQIEYDHFAEWQREIRRIEALGRKGLPPSAYQILCRLAAAALGSTSTDDTTKVTLPKGSESQVEKESTKIIEKLRSFNAENWRTARRLAPKSANRTEE